MYIFLHLRMCVPTLGSHQGTRNFLHPRYSTWHPPTNTHKHSLWRQRIINTTEKALFLNWHHKHRSSWRWTRTQKPRNESHPPQYLSLFRLSQTVWTFPNYTEATSISGEDRLKDKLQLGALGLLLLSASGGTGWLAVKWRPALVTAVEHSTTCLSTHARKRTPRLS